MLPLAKGRAPMGSSAASRVEKADWEAGAKAAAEAKERNKDKDRNILSVVDLLGRHSKDRCDVDREAFDFKVELRDTK